MNGKRDPWSGSAGAEVGSDGTASSASERRIPTAAYSRPAQSAVSRSEEDDARSSSKYRAALEAMFAKKSEPVAEPIAERAAKIVTVRMLDMRDDPRRKERDKRLAKLMAAEGRAAVTKTCQAYLRAGFALPEEQDVMLKVLDHDEDERVLHALATLSKLLDAEAPHRRAVLETRLRRLESDSDDAGVGALAQVVRTKLPRWGDARAREER
jgi:hypothetical protein